jgi:hypothetical protein
MQTLWAARWMSLPRCLTFRCAATAHGPNVLRLASGTACSLSLLANGSDPQFAGTLLLLQIPDLFYRAVVKRKDPAHSGAVVIRFPEDGSTFWLPADEVISWCQPVELRVVVAAFRTTAVLGG